MSGDPSIIGPIVAWRPLRPDDLDGLTTLFNAARAWEGAPDESVTRGEMAHRLADPGLRPSVDSRAGFDARGRLLAWGWVWCRMRPVNLSRAMLQGDVHPEVRRQGIGGALLAWQLRRAEERLRGELPVDLPRRIDLFAPPGDAARGALARASGLEPLRWFHKMARSLAGERPTAPSPADAPPGVRIVAWSDSFEHAALVARNDAWRDHWGYEPMPSDVWRHLLLADPAFLRSSSRVALAGDDIAGMVLCSAQAVADAANGRTAWLDHILVRRPWRRRGLAGALMDASMAALAADGYATVVLDVDADSPTGALGLYEGRGFGIVRTETLFGRPLEVESTAAS